MISPELAERRGKLASELSSLKIDAFLVSALPNIRYLSGFTGSNALLLLGPQDATLFTDPRYGIQAPVESDCAITVAKRSLVPAALAVIHRRRWRRIGFERSRISYSDYAEMEEKLPAGASLRPVQAIVERHRMVKSKAEIEMIRRSVLTNSLAYENTVRKMKPSMREADLAAELEYQMRRAGAAKTAFETIVASGPRSALPHAQPTTNTISNDQLLLVDMGAMQDGYASDMTRMMHLGKPGTRARKLYKAVLEAQLAALSAVREGATAASVDRKARQVLKAHGYDKLFVHSTGHGLGLEIHEAPRLGKTDRTPLESGMAITIEPGAYIEGFGGVRIEDTVLVTKTGCEVLTPTSKDLLVM
ncbi:MAG: M24 family metallopeptidase [Bryobacteraceae bacterium]